MPYIIEGTANLTEEEVIHKQQFYEVLEPFVTEQSTSAKLFFKEKYEKITHVCQAVSDGVPVKELKKQGYTQAGEWAKKYGIFSLESSEVVAVKQEGVDADRLKRLSYYERIFSDILAIHNNGYPKGNTLFDLCRDVYDNIPRGVCKIFTDTCPGCVAGQHKSSIVSKRPRRHNHIAEVSRKKPRHSNIKHSSADSKRMEDTMTNDNNHVYIITMGGTIDKDYPRLTSGYAFEFGEETAASRILKMHPNLGITYDVTSICKKDSQEINEGDRKKLLLEILRIIGDNQSTVSKRKRIVVTHGTDTMIETAKYLQEKLGHNPPGNMQITVALTGATKPERFVDSDAAFNLGSAISVTSQGNGGISVMICMNGNVIPADKCGRLANGVFCLIDKV